MKSLTRWLLTLALAAVPLTAVVDTASANTELVPASRLVAPYVVVNAGKSTFLLLTNRSSVDMRGSEMTTGPFFSVHLQFYDRNCNRTDRPVHLSPFDIDQVDVMWWDIPGHLTEAFLDLDVRMGATGSQADLYQSTSAQVNSLLGEVVIADTAGDYTLSYPMASIVGSAADGAGTPIVTRDAAGQAALWTGRYEPLPPTLVLPGYYAEGGAAATAGTVTESLLAVVSPADGNWYGASGCPVLEQCGEAPGQALATTAPLVNMPAIIVYDGCEHAGSRAAGGHMVIGSITGLFGALLDRNAPAPGPWSAANCTVGVFPGFDELSGVPVGWIDLPNTSCVRSANFSQPQVTTCSAGGGLGAATPGTAGVAKVRGMAGVFFEASVVSGAGATRGADVTRLWGVPSPFSADAVPALWHVGCTTSAGSAVLCKYNIENAAGLSATHP